METRVTMLESAAASLAADGWWVGPGLLTEEQTEALAVECLAMHTSCRMTPARVGANRAASPLRGDHTRWFEMTALSTPQADFVAAIEALRLHLNGALMTGLVDSESHYAVYAPGAGYARHLDRLRHSDARVVSAVFYLNHGWQESDGGALRLHLGDGAHRDIYPQAGNLVLFLSDRFEHEVLTTRRLRMSIACWMRRRELGVVPQVPEAG